MTTKSAATTSQPTLPDGLRLGPVHLTVTDLDRSIGFYESAIGLQLARRDGSDAALGAGGQDLLVLVEQPRRAAGRAARRPLPLRAAAPVAPGAGSRGAAPDRPAGRP